MIDLLLPQHAVANCDIPARVCLVWRRGKLLQADAAGLRNIEARLPVERNTIFRIASMSKPVTTAAAMILMERGVWRLEDPITKRAFLFAAMQVLRRADGPLQDTYPAPRAITIEDLMTHRAGLRTASRLEGRSRRRCRRDSDSNSTARARRMNGCKRWPRCP